MENGFAGHLITVYPARMDIKTYLTQKRSDIGEHLAGLAAEYTASLEPAASSAHSVMERILEFSVSGKMIRGALVFLGHSLFSSCAAPEIIDAACAMELFQSGLLIHDDIMDRDATRRGMPTIHMQYMEECAALGSREPGRAGEALGVCAGDICFFLGHEALSRATTASSARFGAPSSLGAYCSRELAMVGLAQMKDVEWGLTPQFPSTEDVIRMYRHKTARYTFSMPLAAGAILASRPESIGILEAIGERIGIVFQIRDDELGLFATECELGKPVGSDIREGKKTLYYIELMQKSDPAERQTLSAIFGNQLCTSTDIEYVRSRIIDLGIKEEMNKRTERLCGETDHLIESLAGNSSLNPESYSLLTELAGYATHRSY